MGKQYLRIALEHYSDIVFQPIRLEYRVTLMQTAYIGRSGVYERAFRAKRLIKPRKA